MIPKKEKVERYGSDPVSEEILLRTLLAQIKSRVPTGQLLPTQRIYQISGLRLMGHSPASNITPLLWKVVIYGIKLK